jgi:hypothetical protein
LRAAADRPGRTINDVIDEVYPAIMGEVLLIDQLQSYRRAAPPCHVRLAVSRQPFVAQKRCLVEGEFQANGVGRDDNGEERG